MIFIFPYDVFFFICCLGMYHYKCEGRWSPNTEKNPAKQILRKTSCIANKNRKKGFQGWKKNYTLAAFEKIITPFQNVLITSTDSLMIFFPWFLSPNFQKEKNQQQVVNTHVISLTVSFSLICLFFFLFFRFI